jgi:hypothetical protein
LGASRTAPLFRASSAVDEAKALPKRGAGVRVGAMIGQHAGELVTVTQADWLRDDAHKTAA